MFRSARSANRGLYKDSKFTKQIAAEFPHAIGAEQKGEDAVKRYRRVLAAQPDRSVVINTLGYLTKRRDLLKSGTDEHSPLTGKELVINDWTDGPLREQAATVQFQDGQRLPIRLEYYDNTHVAAVELAWPPPGGKRPVIDFSQLQFESANIGR